MKNKLFFKLFFLTFIILIVSILGFRLNIYAIDCDDYSIEEYVNSDSLLNSDTYSIKDYPEIINSRGGIRNHGTGYYWENIGMDDYIVDIIPKSLPENRIFK